MSLTVKEGDQKEYKLPPTGSHLARCYRVIDLGTQKTTWQGVEKAMKKVMLVWELHGEDNEGNPLTTDDGKPLVISKRFTPSLSPKATLRAFLTAWRGRDFTNDELQGFHLKNILDKWCMVNVTHNDKGDKKYANISSIGPVPNAIKKAGLPDGVNPLVWFDIDEPDMETYDAFPDYLKELINASPEWRMRNHDAPPVHSAASGSEEDDDIPFN